LDPLGPLEHKDLLVLRDPQDPPVPTVQMAPPDSVLIKFGWPKEIPELRQTSLLRSLPADPQGRQELPVRKDPQGRPDQRVRQEPKELWEPQELLARKAPQGRQVQREPTVRTANPCSTAPSILQLAQVRLATSI
jgi:hypothetical protein